MNELHFDLRDAVAINNLRNAQHDEYAQDEWTELIDAALAAERRAAAKRIRAALLHERQVEGYLPEDNVFAILDAEVGR